MNLGTMRASVYIRAGVSSTDGLITAAAVNDAINEALHVIEMEDDWPWLQKKAVLPTVAGTGLYAMPADWMRTLDVRFDTTDATSPDVTLHSEEPYELLERWAIVANSRPEEWSVYDDQLILRPVPDAVYQIAHTYSRPEIDLVLDADVPLMPANEHMGIVAYATYISLRRDAEDPRAASALNAYTMWLNRDRGKRRRVAKPWRPHVREGYEL